MTNEEKARAYDEALKDMRVIYPNLRGDAKLAVEHAFPQLAESEDERIRKYIVDFVKLEKGVNLPPDDADRMLAYLEKQKPAEWIEDSVKFEEGFKAGRESGLRDGQKYVLNNLDSYGLCKSAEWSDEDEKMLENIRYALRYAYFNSVIDEQTTEYVMDWLKSFFGLC